MGFGIKWLQSSLIIDKQLTNGGAIWAPSKGCAVTTLKGISVECL